MTIYIAMGLNNYIVTQPTKDMQACMHLLDLIFSTQPEMLCDLKIVPGISDHEAVTFQLNLCVNKPSSINLHKVHVSVP